MKHYFQNRLFPLFSGTTLFVLLFLLILVIPFLYMALFNTAQYDDIIYYKIMHDSGGWWAFQKHFYSSWSSLYSSNAIVSAYTLLLPSDLLPIVISLFVIGLSYFVPFYFAKGTLGRGNAFIFSFVLFFLMFTSYNDIGSMFYWVTSSVAYQLGLIESLALLWVTVILHDKNTWLNKTFLKTIWLMILFISCGSNVITWVAITLSGGFYILFVSISTRKIRKNHLFAFCSLCFVSLLLISSPGNNKRSIVEWLRRGHDISNDNFSDIVTRAFKASFESIDYAIFKYVPEWLFSSPLILIVLVLLPSLLIVSKNIKHAIHPLLLLLIILGAVVMMLFPSYFSMGAYPPDRAINVIFIYFSLSVLFFIVNYFAFYQVKQLTIPSFVSRFGFGLLVFYLFSMPNNVKDAYSDIRSGLFAKTYDQIIKRDKSMIQYGDSLGFSPIIDETRLKLYYDIPEKDNMYRESYTFYIENIKNSK